MHNVETKAAKKSIKKHCPHESADEIEAMIDRAKELGLFGGPVNEPSEQDDLQFFPEVVDVEGVEHAVSATVFYCHAIETACRYLRCRHCGELGYAPLRGERMFDCVEDECLESREKQRKDAIAKKQIEDERKREEFLARELRRDVERACYSEMRVIECLAEMGRRGIEWLWYACNDRDGIDRVSVMREFALVNTSTIDALFHHLVEMEILKQPDPYERVKILEECRPLKWIDKRAMKALIQHARRRDDRERIKSNAGR